MFINKGFLDIELLSIWLCLSCQCQENCIFTLWGNVNIQSDEIKYILNYNYTTDRCNYTDYHNNSNILIICYKLYPSFVETVCKTFYSIYCMFSKRLYFKIR